MAVYLQDEFVYSANRIKMPDDEEEIHGKRIDTSRHKSPESQRITLLYRAPVLFGFVWRGLGVDPKLMF